MGGRIAIGFGTVAGRGEDPAVAAVHQDRAHRHLAAGRGGARLGQRQAHRVGRHRGAIIWGTLR
jgi:hypothetical protein